MSECAVWTRELSRNFGDVKALENITFSLAYGHVAAVVGPNGSGKSTFLRLLLGLLRPTQGKARVLGLEPFSHADSLRSRVGVLLEYRKDPGNLSVLESLQSAGDPDAPNTQMLHTIQAGAQSAGERASRIDDLLYRFDLWPERHQRVVDLSRSAREKLAVVATLVPKPLLLLLDEPLATLDLDHRLGTLAVLRDVVRHDHATLLFTTNTLEDAEAIADDVLMLANGRVTVQGALASLLGEPTLPMLEITGRGFTDEVVSLLQRRHEVATVHRQPNRLLVQFNRACDTAPLVSLLVESSADIDEVHKRRWDLHARYHQLLSSGETSAPGNSETAPPPVLPIEQEQAQQ